LRNADPDGYLTILVPGTWNDNEEWSKSEFRIQVSRTFGEDAKVLSNNNMGNSREARSAAVKELKAMIAGHKFAPGEKLNIVAHSHGGNVAFQASNELEHKIDNLVTLGTPIRSDYQPNSNAIGCHINVYSQFDGVQTMGGFTDTSMTIGFGAQVPVHREVGPAGRSVGSATNIEAGFGDKGGLDSHSALWKNKAVWEKVEPLLKK
jgi:pimeloyl-ACP methyl ester carboxylesterase